VTIFVPALNEAQKLQSTIDELVEAAEKNLDDYEILIFDDGSTDGTAAIADGLAETYSHIRVIHNPLRRGLAVNFRSATAQAKYPYITIVPGDGAFRTDGIATLLGAAGNADMVLSYRTNQWQTRSWIRCIIARSLTIVANLLYGLKLKDVDSLAVFPVSSLRTLNLIAANNGFWLEMVVKLRRLPLSFVVVGIALTPEDHVFGRSLLEFRSVADVLRIIVHLLFPNSTRMK
jgi:glycosyltransferase involved in cell wall biosynthesis